MENKDSRAKSLVESLFNISVGIIVGFMGNIIILPLFGMPFSYVSFAWISLFFTMIGIVRSYLVRRLFVNGFYEWLNNTKN